MSLLLIERQERVLRLTLNRPDKRNALNEEMCRLLVDAIAGAQDDPHVGSILIDANGRVFSAGSWFRNHVVWRFARLRVACCARVIAVSRFATIRSTPESSSIIGASRWAMPWAMVASGRLSPLLSPAKATVNAGPYLGAVVPVVAVELLPVRPGAAVEDGEVAVDGEAPLPSSSPAGCLCRRDRTACRTSPPNSRGLRHRIGPAVRRRRRR